MKKIVTVHTPAKSFDAKNAFRLIARVIYNMYIFWLYMLIQQNEEVVTESDDDFLIERTCDKSQIFLHYRHSLHP